MEPARDDFPGVVCLGADAYELADRSARKRRAFWFVRFATESIVAGICWFYVARMADGRSRGHPAGTPPTTREELGMSRFTEALKIIPRTVWYLAIVCYLGIATLLLTVMIPADKEMKYWPLV